jgi:hypothetical protein
LKSLYLCKDTLTLKFFIFLRNGENIPKCRFLKGMNDTRKLVDFWSFNATFSNILAISWRPVLVVEEAGEPIGGISNAISSTYIC